jgi:hypothetical protein
MPPTHPIGQGTQSGGEVRQTAEITLNLPAPAKQGLSKGSAQQFQTVSARRMMGAMPQGFPRTFLRRDDLVRRPSCGVQRVAVELRISDDIPLATHLPDQASRPRPPRSWAQSPTSRAADRRPRRHAAYSPWQSPPRPGHTGPRDHDCAGPQAAVCYR